MLKSKPFLIGEHTNELPDLFVASVECASNVPIQGDRVFDALGGVEWLLNRKHTTKVDEKIMHHCDFCAQGSVKLYECQARLFDRICIIYCLTHSFSRVGTQDTARQNARSVIGRITVSVFSVYILGCSPRSQRIFAGSSVAMTTTPKRDVYLAVFLQISQRVGGKENESQNS
jgi:hypothetical protein